MTERPPRARRGHRKKIDLVNAGIERLAALLEDLYSPPVPGRYTLRLVKRRAVYTLCFTDLSAALARAYLVEARGEALATQLFLPDGTKLERRALERHMTDLFHTEVGVDHRIAPLRQAIRAGLTVEQAAQQVGVDPIIANLLARIPDDYLT